jgi:DNA-binding CsgD family transcriptional regulator
MLDEDIDGSKTITFRPRSPRREAGRTVGSRVTGAPVARDFAMLGVAQMRTGVGACESSERGVPASHGTPPAPRRRVLGCGGTRCRATDQEFSVDTLSDKPVEPLVIDHTAGDQQLVGRDDDLRRVLVLLEDSVVGGGSLVVVGDAGIGKTALLTTIARVLTSRGTQVAWAAAARFESDIAYAGLSQLFVGLQGAFDQLDANYHETLRTALGFGAGPAASRMLVSHAALLLVRSVARKEPLLLVVDDLPALDRASAEVLAFVSRRLTGSAVRFLGAAGTGSAEMGEFGTLPQHRVRPLTEQAAQELLSRRFPALAPTARRRVMAEAAGNPGALLKLPEGRTERQQPAAEPVMPMTMAASPAPEEARIHGRSRLLAVTASAARLIDGDGDVRTAHDLLASAIEAGDHPCDGTNEELSDAMHLLLVLSWQMADPDAWDRCLKAVARLEPPVDEALTVASRLFRDPARTDASTAARLRSMLANLHSETDPAYVSRVAGLAGFLDWSASAREDLWRVVRQGRAGTASIRAHVTALAGLGFELFHTGQWDRLAEVVDEGARLCDKRGFTFGLWQFRYHRALLAAARGDSEPVDADELLRWAPARHARGVEIYARAARASHHLGQGRYAAAYRDAAATGPAGTFPEFAPQVLGAGFDFVEAAVHTGHLAEAAAHAAAMGNLPVTGLSSRLALLSAGAAGMVVGDAEIRTVFGEALRTPDIDHWPFDQARVRLVYGERLRRLHATREAREQLTAAADIFQNLGARSWLARASNELRASRLSRRRSSPPKYAALTFQEWEIAELAASGMSNKQIGERLFLSHRTISSHLYHIFPKLGLTSRAGLRDALVGLAERSVAA